MLSGQIDISAAEAEKLASGVLTADRIQAAIRWDDAPPWATHYRVIYNGALWQDAATNPERIFVAPLFGVGASAANALPKEIRVFSRPHERVTRKPVFGRGEPGHVADIETEEGAKRLQEEMVARYAKAGIDVTPDDAVRFKDAPEKSLAEKAMDRCGGLVDPQTFDGITMEILTQRKERRAEELAKVPQDQEKRFGRWPASEPMDGREVRLSDGSFYRLVDPQTYGGIPLEAIVRAHEANVKPPRDHVAPLFSAKLKDDPSDARAAYISAVRNLSRAKLLAGHARGVLSRAEQAELDAARETAFARKAYLKATLQAAGIETGEGE